MKKIISISLCVIIIVSTFFICYFTKSQNSESDSIIQYIENKKFINGPVLYQSDFNKLTSVEQEFSIGFPCFSEETSDNYSAQIQKQDKKSVLTFSSEKCAPYIALPTINTRNYIFEAEVKISTNNNATLGIVNDMQGGVAKAKGAVIFNLRLNENKSIWSYYSIGLDDIDTIEAQSLGKPMKNPKNGDVVKIKLISLDDTNFIFINNTLLASYPRPNREGNYDNPGLFISDGEINILNLKVTAACDLGFALNDVQFNIDTQKQDISFDVSLTYDKNDNVYNLLYNGDYTLSDNSALKFGLFIAESFTSDHKELNENTPNVTNVILDNFTQDQQYINFSYSLCDISKDKLDKPFTIKAYALLNNEYFYFNSINVSPVQLANQAFLTASENEKEILKQIFADVKGFNSTGVKSITFGLFSDFHYKEGMYIASISNLNEIFERAYLSNASFVISSGDMTNDMKGSPELVNAFKNNKFSLFAYNVYGNHELETEGNTMEFVTPTLTNDANVIWGTKSGKIEDGTIGYYYAQRDGFRLIFLDTNYYYEKGTNILRHNPGASWGPPEDSVGGASLGSEQLKWLENVLMDAADKDIPCIVISHNSILEKFGGLSSEATKVKAIYKKANNRNPGTVVMSINGHTHQNAYAWEDGIFYFNMNATLNINSHTSNVIHSTYNDTYMKEVYDNKGNLLELVETSLGSSCCRYSESPLSAIVTVYENGVIEIDGYETNWFCGTGSEYMSKNIGPIVTSGIFTKE